MRIWIASSELFIIHELSSPPLTRGLIYPELIITILFFMPHLLRFNARAQSQTQYVLDCWLNDCLHACLLLACSLAMLLTGLLFCALTRLHTYLLSYSLAYSPVYLLAFLLACFLACLLAFLLARLLAFLLACLLLQTLQTYWGNTSKLIYSPTYNLLFFNAVATLLIHYW